MLKPESLIANILVATPLDEQVIDDLLIIHFDNNTY